MKFRKVLLQTMINNHLAIAHSKTINKIHKAFSPPTSLKIKYILFKTERKSHWNW
jgi:hypothetical protein